MGIRSVYFDGNGLIVKTAAMRWRAVEVRKPHAIARRLTYSDWSCGVGLE